MIAPGERALELDDHSPSARLAYLALRVSGGYLTAGELADAAGISRPAAGRVAAELVAGGWAIQRTREQDSPGPSPTEWRARVACQHCGGKYTPGGVAHHEANCDERELSAHDVADMDPEDLGLGDADKPEPKRGLQ